MTPIEDWVMKTVKALVRDMREETGFARPGIVYEADTEQQHNARWDALELRLAIGLVQARALECRQVSGSMLVKAPPTLREIVDGLAFRSSQLEDMGMRMARGEWPPTPETVGGKPETAVIQ